MLSLTLSLLAGCPSDAPVALPPPPVNQGGGPGAPNGAAPPEGAEGAPPPAADPAMGASGGMGAAPAGGQAGAAPSGPVMPNAGGPQSFKVTPGTGVKLSGTIAYSGKISGKLRVDLLNKENQILHVLSLDKVGPWEVEAPKDLGEVRVSAFIDSDNNGPSTYEPAGEVTVTVAQVPVTGVNVTLKDGSGAAPAATESANTLSGPQPDPTEPDEMGGQQPSPGATPKKPAGGSAPAAGGGAPG